jgi:hypothetical protein
LGTQKGQNRRKKRKKIMARFAFMRFLVALLMRRVSAGLLPKSVRVSDPGTNFII